MDERKPPRPKDDDVPIIGDYSKATDARLHADAMARPDTPSRADAQLREDPRLAGSSSPAPTPPPQRTPPATRAGGESWALDPVDVRRHAQRARQHQRVGPLGKIARYGAVAVVIAAAIAAYWNFDTLRGITIDVSALTSLFAAKGTGNSAKPGPNGEPETVNVAAPVVVGEDAPTSAAVPPAAETKAAPTPASPAEAPVTEAAPTPALAAAESQRAKDESRAEPPAAAPEVPDGPETFEFGIPVIHVSEADASAAVIILRNGGRRRASSVTWWTKDGTAKAGEDYADLGKVVVRFAAGEQNHTIHIPIVSDNRVEGPETFYVYLATGESAIAAGEPTEKVEVVINDRE